MPESRQSLQNPAPGSAEWVAIITEKVYQLWLRDLRLEKERRRLISIKRKRK